MFTPVSSKILTSAKANSVCHLLRWDFVWWPSKYFLAYISAQTNLFHSNFSNWRKLISARILQVSYVQFKISFAWNLFTFAAWNKDKYVIYRLRVDPYRKKLGLLPRSLHSRLRAQFFSIRTSQLVNNKYISISISSGGGYILPCKHINLLDCFRYVCMWWTAISNSTVSFMLLPVDKK